MRVFIIFLLVFFWIIPASAVHKTCKEPSGCSVSIKFTATVVSTKTLAMDIENLGGNLYVVSYTATTTGVHDAGTMTGKYLVIDDRINKNKEPIMTLVFNDTIEPIVPLQVVALEYSIDNKTMLAQAKRLMKKRRRGL